jgi:hypothetical protein
VSWVAAADSTGARPRAYPGSVLRSTAACATLAVAVTLSTLGTLAGPGAAPAPAASGTVAADPDDRRTVRGLPRPDGAYRFVSFPDFLNQDVGDVTRASHWRKGDPTGTNAAYEKSLAHVLDDVASHRPEAFLVAGDLVEGEWGKDETGTDPFGPHRTTPQRKQALKEAARIYYGDWLRRVTDHGLRAYPAVGDHEIGDDPWTPRGDAQERAWIRFKAHHTWLWKRQLVKHTYDAVRRAPGDDLRRVGGVSSPERGQAGDTAYAVRLDRNLLLVTVDVFRPTSNGVSVSLDPDQRAWLSTVLRRAKKQQVPWVVVQGHVPVLGPVRTRFSSGLTYEGSDLWALLRRHDVDAYLCGEVHDHTVIRRQGVVQMCHGGLFYRGESSYVLGQVTETKLMLETRYLEGDPQWSGTKLWSTEGGNGPRRVVYRKPSRVVGTYVLKRDPERPGRTNRVKQARGISGVRPGR